MSNCPKSRTIFILLYLSGQISYRPLQKRCNRLVRIITLLPKIVYLAVLLPSILMLLGYYSKKTKFHKFTAFSRDVSYIFYVGSNLTSLFADLLHPSAPHLLCKQINCIIAYTNYRIYAINTRNIERKFIVRLCIGIFPIACNLILKSVWQSSFTPPIVQLFITAAQTYRLIALLHSVLPLDGINWVLSVLIKHLEEFPNDRKLHNQLCSTFKQMKWIHFKLFRASELYNKRYIQFLWWIALH